MGLLKKLKNIFYDEEVVEVSEPQVKKEADKPKIEEVILPKRNIELEEKKEEPKRENLYSERELFKSETTFNFPIFDDEEEEKPKSRSNYIDIESNNTRSKSNSVFKDTPKTENRTFKPSPVISPIYGILDKSYKKEEIVEKKEISKPKEKETSYDYVRRKAYGSLEDELENTISKLEENPDIETKDEAVHIKSSDDIEELLTKIEKKANISIEEIEEAIKDRDEMEEELSEKIARISEEEEGSKTLEHDLFNLIDSMYDDKEEE